MLNRLEAIESIIQTLSILLSIDIMASLMEYKGTFEAHTQTVIGDGIQHKFRMELSSLLMLAVTTSPAHI